MENVDNVKKVESVKKVKSVEKAGNGVDVKSVESLQCRM